MKTADYDYIIVESFIPSDMTGRHGLVHVRPISGQEPFMTSMFVECSKKLTSDYPVGTKFRIRAKITSREEGIPFVFSSYAWRYEVI